MITQVDEEQVAVIALAMHPSREPDGLADVAGAQGCAGMGTIGVHDQVGSLAKNCGEKRAPRFTGTKLFVNPRGHR
jgi:hypothetical protein